MASFTVAVGRPRKQGQDAGADFLPCVAWEKTAEVIQKYLGKGDPILVEGRIQTRKYQAKDGSNRIATEIIASNIEFCGGGKKQSGQAPAQNGGNYPEYEEVPF